MHKIHPTCAPNRSNSELAVYDRELGGHRIEVSANNTVLPIEVSMSNAPSLSGNADLASLFECPVCFDFALPPIMQCPSGHIVCTVCRSQLTSCPTCRGPLDNIRNLAMEKLAANVLFPCKYISNGCTETLSYSQKPNHEESCAYRPYSCPCPGASCKWFGALDQVLQHLLIQHKSITTLHGEDIVFLATDINLPGAVDWVMMQSCFGYNFMLVLEKQDRHVVLGSGNTAATSVPTTGSNQLNTATVGPLGHSAGSHINSRRILTRNNNGSSSSSHHHMVVPGNTQIQQFYAIVQLIGTHKQAEQFIYRLELSAPRRRLTWEATPRSIHDGVQTAISCSDCLVFDSNVANIFADNGNLGINVTINQICPSSSPITKSPASQ